MVTEKQNRRAHLFKTGNKCAAGKFTSEIVSSSSHCSNTQPQWKSLSKEDFESLVYDASGDSTMFLRDEKFQPLPMKLLRPRIKETQGAAAKTGEDGDETESYRLFHPGKTADLFNMGFLGHQQYSETCQGKLVFDENGECQKGMVWEERLMCKDCGFRSEFVDLFRSISTTKAGRRYAAPNVGLQIGLTHTSIGPTAFRQLCQAMNIPPPSVSGMQKAANFVSEQLVNLNIKSLKEHLDIIREFNIKRGLSPETPIPVEGDARYNIRLKGSSTLTPFQPATQSVYTISENVSKNKFIIGVSALNKHCHKGKILKNKGIDVTCPGHDGCTASITESHTIGDEKHAAKIAAAGIDLPINYITTDGDSHAAEGIQEHQGERPTMLSDTIHLAKAQKRKIQQCEFSARFFPGCVTKVSKTKIQRRLALDLQARCSAEFTSCQKFCNGNVDIMINKLSHVTDAVLKCYSGNCGISCRRYSFVCKGGKKRFWPKPYMPKTFSFLRLTREDEVLLRECVGFRLGPQAIRKTCFGTTTQKSEAVNRGLSKSVPKGVTYKRNFVGRVHSTVHRLNLGLAESTTIKCKELGAPISKGSRVMRSLHSDHRIAKYQKKRSQLNEQKILRRKRTAAKFQLYDQSKADTTYRTGLTLMQGTSKVKKRVQKQKKQHVDHNY